MKGYQPGDTISGKYRLIESVGGGAMGEVFKAEHILMHKTVAVKILHQNVLDNSEIVERFKREAQAAAAIEHSNVCNVTDFALTEDNEFYLVMEYLEGDTLQKRIRAKGALTAEETIFIMQQLLSVLQCAHELGIVHRDVKPENIALIHKEETDDFVKLLDFGIAHQDTVCHHLEDGEEKFKTQAGFVYGTPEYISPEQANGQAVDARADLYACGIILYEMLTGEVPFKSDSLIGLLQQQVFASPPHLDFNKVEHASEFDVIIQKLLSKDREDRYASARDVIYALDEILLGTNEDSGAQDNVPSGNSRSGESSYFEVIKDTWSKCEEEGQLIFKRFASTSWGAKIIEKTSKIPKNLGIIIGCVAVVLVIIGCVVAMGSPEEVNVQNLDWNELPKLRSVSGAQPFVYDDEFSVDNDETLSKDENLKKASNAYLQTDYKTCYDNVIAVDGRYREHPNYLRLRIIAAYSLAKTSAMKKDSDRYEMLMNSILTDFIELSAKVPDAGRLGNIHNAVGLVFTDSRKYKAAETLTRVANFEEEFGKINKIQIGASKAEKLAAGLAWAIIYLPYDQDEERKKNMFKAYESLPESHAVPAWQKAALAAWKLGKDECKKREVHIKNAFQQGDSQEELYYGLLIPLYNNLRLDIKDKYKRYQCKSNIFKQVDCNYCIKTNIISGYEAWSKLADAGDLRSAENPFSKDSNSSGENVNDDKE